VTLETPESGVGTRFTIRIPIVRGAVPQPAAGPAENGAVQTSTTTGKTIGRRRSRS
jgi:hypothetical protein